MRNEKRVSRVLRPAGLLMVAGMALQGCGGGGDSGGFAPTAAAAPVPAPAAEPAPAPASKSGAEGPTVAQLQSTCNTLAGRVISGVTVTSAARFEAQAPIYTSGFCQVLGTRAPYLDIEIDVPDNWTGDRKSVV